MGVMGVEQARMYAWFAGRKTSSAARNRLGAVRVGLDVAGTRELRTRSLVSHVRDRPSPPLIEFGILLGTETESLGFLLVFSWFFLESWGKGSLQLLGCATASCSQETPPLVESSLAGAVALLI